MGQVKCSICSETKPTKEFYKKDSCKDGLYGYCKKCYTAKKNKNRVAKGLPAMAVRRPCKEEKVCPVGTKQCCKCLEVKEFSYFSKLKSSKDGYSHQCKSCCKKLRDMAGKTVIRRHSNNMSCAKHHYKITEEQLQDMLLEQQGCCALCGVDFGTKIVKNKGRQYHIDHSHDTGKVRGLICNACNTYVGAIESRETLNCPPIIKEYIARGSKI